MEKYKVHKTAHNGHECPMCGNINTMSSGHQWLGCVHLKRIERKEIKVEYRWYYKKGKNKLDK
jgi:hypothetical protein